MLDKKSDKKSFLFLISKQIKTVVVHTINLLSNILGNDYISCQIRKFLFEAIGASLGNGTTIKGGGYLYGGGLRAGENCYINRNCYFDFAETIYLGNYVTVGHGVTFITAKHSIGDTNCRAGKASGLSITIEDGVWIGANVTILPGITIKQGAIVAAGAVVVEDIPANVVVAGVPAKIIKSLPLEIETK